MSEPNGGNPPVNPPILAEPIEAPDPRRLAHLGENRSLIVRRSLLSTAIGGIQIQPSLRAAGSSAPAPAACKGIGGDVQASRAHR